MVRSSRDVVRSAVGLAVVAPAAGLGVLAVMLVLDGGTSGVLAGLFVGLIALALLVGALMMTHAPVTIANLLEGSKDEGESSSGGRNGGPGGDRERGRQNGPGGP